MTLKALDVRFLIKSAMINRQLVEFSYENEYVVGEPHVYGIKINEIHLLVYQICGQNNERVPCWRDVTVEKISDLKPLGYHFQGKRKSVNKLRGRFEKILEIII